MLCRLHPRGALRRALLRSTSRPRPLAAVAPVSAPPAAPALAPPSAVEPVTSAYVHLPFCRRRCFYCSFDIQVLGDRGGDSRLRAVTSYVDAVVADVAACPLPCGPLRTVFFGGGTPSLVPPAQLARVLAALRARCGLAPDAEVSLECDPGTFSRASLEAYLALGVTRINVGVQSFDQDALAVAGRAHSAEDVANALADVKAANPPSWGLDLISGLPHVSAAQWDATLAAAVAVAPHHVSVYDLQVEPRTLFGRRYVPGKFPLPGEGAAADMYRAAVRCGMNVVLI